jgi:hypothetical protein
MVDVIVLVPSSRMILNDWFKPVPEISTLVHEATNRRFGAVPIVWYWHSPGPATRSSQNPAMTAFGSAGAGRQVLFASFAPKNENVRKPLVDR